MLEINLWNPGPVDPDKPLEKPMIIRSDRIPDTIPNISRFQQVVLHQGRIERFFLDSIHEHSIRTSCNGEGRDGKIDVEHGVLPATFSFDETLADDLTAHPISVRVRHLTEEEATPKQSATSSNGQAVQDGIFRSNLAADDTDELIASSSHLASKAGREEVIHAKFMLGADGAHSWTRNQLGFKLRGDSTDYVWGVLDVIPITDFPDIRMRCAIHSEANGSLMVIPRENKLVRLYIQLTTTNEDGSAAKKVDRSTITPESIIASAQRILQPYRITYKYLDWWTAYQIGQRVGDSFSLQERVFLAGDAVHTHSPKAGQGMNVSMQDAYNLGWKVAGAVKGLWGREVLKTYQSERRRIAQDLIDFDHRFSRLFSGRPAKDVMDEEGISMEVFKEAFEKGNMFASGVAVDYGASSIVAKAGDSAEQGDGTVVLAKVKTGDRVISKQDLATDVRVGMRMPSFKVLNQADARPWHFQELLSSNGTWRVVVFPGDIRPEAVKKRLAALGEKLGAQDSFLKKYTPRGQKYDSIIELLTVHKAPRTEATMFDFPEVFRPWGESEGWDYWKIFVDDAVSLSVGYCSRIAMLTTTQSYHEGNNEAYKNYGIDPSVGCSVIIRPDQYVSWVGEWDDYEAMNKFFGGFMLEQSRGEQAETNGVTIKSDYIGTDLSKGVRATDEAVTGAGGL